MARGKSERKAAHRRSTPKRKHVMGAFTNGHILECGAAAPLFDRRYPRSNNQGAKGSGPNLATEALALQFARL